MIFLNRVFSTKIIGLDFNFIVIVISQEKKMYKFIRINTPLLSYLTNKFYVFLFELSFDSLKTFHIP